MAGGWHLAEADETVRQVIRTAIQRQAERAGAELALVAIDQLEQQVVAGMNYRALLRVRQGTEERRARMAAFRALDGHVELVDWQWLSVP